MERTPGFGIGKISLIAQLVKNPPAIWETWVRFLSWEDPLEKGTPTHSSILAWRIPQTEELGRLQSMRSQRVGHSFHSLTWVQIQAQPLANCVTLKICLTTSSLSFSISKMGIKISASQDF